MYYPWRYNPANICSKSKKKKTPEDRHCGAFIVNFKYISHLLLVFLLLALNK